MAKLLIHLVHGTQFYVLRKPDVPWVEDEDERASDTEDLCAFRRGVRKQLRDKGHEVEFDAVLWSGRNRHGARLAAAAELQEHVLRKEGDSVHHFVVAHSHGGNACLLALKNGRAALAEKISGIACLSTPFLIVREAAWAVNSTIAWLTLVVFAGCWLLYTRIDPAPVAFALWLILFSLSIGALMTVMRRYKDVTRWAQAPERCDVPFLIVRCPGDEASSGLGFVAILARVLYHLEHLAAWPLRMLKRHPVGLWLGTSVAALALAFAAVFDQPFQGWIGANWPWIVLVLLAPWLVGLPARLVIYGLAYGVDLFGLPLLHSISAEPTPLGRWESWLVPTSNSRNRRAAHSEAYELRSVQRIVADWIHEQVTSGSGDAAEGSRVEPAQRSLAAAGEEP
jgi:hypothetical protein